jgi:cytochrome c
MASYQDKGGTNGKLLTARAGHVFRSPRWEAESNSGLKSLKVIGKLEDGNSRYLGEVNNWAHVSYKNIDLTQVGSVTLQYACIAAGSSVEVRLGSAKGEMIGQTAVKPTGGLTAWQQLTIPLKKTSGNQDVYFVFRNDKSPKNLLNLDWMNYNPVSSLK